MRIGRRCAGHRFVGRRRTTFDDRRYRWPERLARGVGVRAYFAQFELELAMTTDDPPPAGHWPDKLIRDALLEELQREAGA
jgi:hypothetical protein